jgi:hypothetical protein
VVILKLTFIPCAESAQIVAEQPRGAVELKAFDPTGYRLICSAARGGAIHDALLRELAPRVAAFEPKARECHERERERDSR